MQLDALYSQCTVWPVPHRLVTLCSHMEGRTLAERVTFLVISTDICAIEFSSVGLRAVVADVTLSIQ